MSQRAPHFGKEGEDDKRFLRLEMMFWMHYGAVLLYAWPSGTAQLIQYRLLSDPKGVARSLLMVVSQKIPGLHAPGFNAHCFDALGFDVLGFDAAAAQHGSCWAIIVSHRAFAKQDRYRDVLYRVRRR